MPLIRQSYYLQEDEWLEEQKKDFFEKVQTDLIDRLASRTKEI
ncbi:hypothetical protein QUE94_08350 [Lactococcus lactis]|nr:hypothetical protein [Lactococcus lactis]